MASYVYSKIAKKSPNTAQRHCPKHLAVRPKNLIVIDEEERKKKENKKKQRKQPKENGKGMQKWQQVDLNRGKFKEAINAPSINLLVRGPAVKHKDRRQIYMQGYHDAINYVRREWLSSEEITYEENPLVRQAGLDKAGKNKRPFDYVREEWYY